LQTGWFPGLDSYPARAGEAHTHNEHAASVKASHASALPSLQTKSPSSFPACVAGPPHTSLRRKVPAGRPRKSVVVCKQYLAVGRGAGWGCFQATCCRWLHACRNRARSTNPTAESTTHLREQQIYDLLHRHLLQACKQATPEGCERRLGATRMLGVYGLRGCTKNTSWRDHEAFIMHCGLHTHRGRGWGMQMHIHGCRMPWPWANKLCSCGPSNHFKAGSASRLQKLG